MSVYIYEQDAFEKIVEVEGERYRKFRNENAFRDCSFEAFLKEWTNNYSQNPEKRNFKPEFGVTVNGNAAIYGVGGWNRYFVRNNGEIVFSRLHATSEGIEKASEIGFNLW